jgi:hypothetical protein
VIEKDGGDFEIVLGDGEVEWGRAGFEMAGVDVGVMFDEE